MPISTSDSQNKEPAYTNLLFHLEWVWDEKNLKKIFS